MEYAYVKAPEELARRAGLAGMRKSAGSGFVILSMSDLRMVDMTSEEKIQFFGCEPLTEEQAMLLAREETNTKKSEEDETHANDQETGDTVPEDISSDTEINKETNKEDEDNE